MDGNILHFGICIFLSYVRIADVFTVVLHTRAVTGFAYISGKTTGVLLNLTQPQFCFLLVESLPLSSAAPYYLLCRRCRCTNTPLGGKVVLVVEVTEMQDEVAENRNGYHRGW